MVHLLRFPLPADQLSVRDSGRVGHPALVASGHIGRPSHLFVCIIAQYYCACKELICVFYYFSLLLSAVAVLSSCPNVFVMLYELTHLILWLYTVSYCSEVYRVCLP